MTAQATGTFLIERRLMEDARGGDLVAFDRLVALHEEMVLRVAQRLLLNRDEARDAAQEVLMRLHHYLPGIEADRALKPWLYRVTVNVCRDFQRKWRKHASLGEADAVRSQEPNPEDAAYMAQAARLLLGALTGLTPREREVIVLRDLEAKTTREVAEILHSSEGTVRSHLSTGRARLRDLLSAHLGDSI